MADGTGLGFFGKVATHGDFVSRRLPAAFVGPWDGWLQQGLRTSRDELGPGWLALYLNSPFWRFGLPPGVCGNEGWTGVMMPSIDRVGRHFPLTLAAPTHGPVLQHVTAQDAWYRRLEALALTALREEFVLDDFDRELDGMAAPGVRLAAAGEALAFVPTPGRPIGDQLADPGGALLCRLADAMLASHAVWWTEGAPEVAPTLLVSRGLPAPRGYTALLDGQWERHGWSVAGGTAAAS